MPRKSFIFPVKSLWEPIRYSYWVIPAAMALGSFGLAIALIQVDRIAGEGLLAKMGWIYAGGADGAREVLSVIAGSMITVAGVVFSITMVALTLASSQFGPRVLRNFMQDRGSQVVLGAFIASFVYSLTILRTIQGENGGVVPQLSVTVGFLMALASLGFLIYFIHHVALSIQASQIVARIGHELLHSINEYFPEEDDDGAEDGKAELPDGFEREAGEIAARMNGYLQTINEEDLVRAAAEADVVLTLRAQPGDFVSPYKPLLLCAPSAHLTEDLTDRLRSAFRIGSERSHTQDVIFAVDQLVEVAVRALSPSLNDPFTAIRCLDWLGAALSRVLHRRTPRAVHEDTEGHLRLISHPVEFQEMTDAAFEQILEYGLRSAAVTVRVLETLRYIAPHVRTEEERASLLRHARQALEGSRSALALEQDKATVEEQFRQFTEVLDKGVHSQ